MWQARLCVASLSVSAWRPAETTLLQAARITELHFSQMNESYEVFDGETRVLVGVTSSCSWLSENWPIAPRLTA